MATWLIRKDASVQHYWRRLATRPAAEREAFAEAERVLSETPYPIDHAAGTLKHLKGGYHCNHEYRTLPNAQRIYYKIWTRRDIANALKRREAGVPVEPQWESEDQKGVVIFLYAGPHPKVG